MADLDTIHREMLEELDPSYQKTPGFPAYDFTRAFALGLASLAGDVEAAEARLDPENLTGADLDRYVWQHRAVERKQAACAQGTLKITSGSGHISAGALFATGAGVQFMSEEDKDVSAGSTFAASAVEPGSAGNAAAGTVTVMPVTIAGIGGVTNPAAFAGGYDEESDAELRARYYEALQRPANGCNVYQYEQWCKAVEEVGRAVVVPTPRGPCTVDVYLVDRTGDPASAALVAEVQALLDPNHNGDGSGEAPIGAEVTVKAAERKSLDFEVTLSILEGYVHANVHTAVRASLIELFRRTALAGTVLRFSAVVEATLVEGVADYIDLTINGQAGTVTFEKTEVPVMGSFTIHWEDDADESS